MKEEKKPSTCTKTMLRNAILSRRPDFTLPFPIGNAKEMNIKINQISHIKSDGILSQVHFYNKKTKSITCTIGDCEEKLVEYAFLRAHRSYLINCSYIHNITWERDGVIELLGGDVIPTPRRRKEEVIEYLHRMNFTHLL